MNIRVHKLFHNLPCIRNVPKNLCVYAKNYSKFRFTYFINFHKVNFCAKKSASSKLRSQVWNSVSSSFGFIPKIRIQSMQWNSLTESLDRKYLSSYPQPIKTNRSICVLWTGDESTRKTAIKLAKRISEDAFETRKTQQQWRQASNVANFLLCFTSISRAIVDLCDFSPVFS